MKKLFAVVLVLALIGALSVSAFAAGSPRRESLQEQVVEEEGLEICLRKDGSVSRKVPAADVRIVEFADADKLDKEDQDEFLHMYGEMQNVEDRAVVAVFWMELTEKYTTSEDEFLKYEFECEGENVQVLQNGEFVEVVEEEEENQYYAMLSVKEGKVGTVVILCDIGE